MELDTEIEKRLKGQLSLEKGHLNKEDRVAAAALEVVKYNPSAIGSAFDAKNVNLNHERKINATNTKNSDLPDIVRSLKENSEILKSSSEPTVEKIAKEVKNIKDFSEPVMFSERDTNAEFTAPSPTEKFFSPLSVAPPIFSLLEPKIGEALKGFVETTHIFSGSHEPSAKNFKRADSYNLGLKA